jgi:hypothetical protein
MSFEASSWPFRKFPEARGDLPSEGPGGFSGSPCSRKFCVESCFDATACTSARFGRMNLDSQCGLPVTDRGNEKTARGRR